MKRYALISVILLVAFMWSCENKSSSPYTPEDLTTLATDGGDGTVTTAGKGGNGKGKGPGKKTATYTVDIYFGTDHVGSHIDAYMEPNWLNASDMDLNLAVLGTLSPLKGCFTGATYPGNLSLGQNINFFFKTTPVKYLLMMMAEDPREGIWPPANQGDTTTFTGSELWLGFHGGGGRKNACEGTVDINWIIEVTKN